MTTITARKFRQLLEWVPDNTPIYVDGHNGEDGFVSRVSIVTNDFDNFKIFEIKIDWCIK